MSSQEELPRRYGNGPRETNLAAKLGKKLNSIEETTVDLINTGFTLKVENLLRSDLNNEEFREEL